VPRAKVLGQLRAHGTVAAVGSHQQIRIGSQRPRVLDATAVFDLDPFALACALQHPEHVDARGAREVVAVDLHVGAAMHDIHVVAALVVGDELFEERRVGILQEAQADVGEHHAPAVGRALGVLLEDADAVGAIVLLGKQREIQAGRAGTDDVDLHDAFSE